MSLTSDTSENRLYFLINENWSYLTYHICILVKIFSPQNKAVALLAQEILCTRFGNEFKIFWTSCPQI